MFIPPKRRRRIMRAHHLRQLGHTLRQIAEKLNISVATVRADLKLAQTHWATIAAASADDLLLESLQLLQVRLTRAIKNDDVSRTPAASPRLTTSAPATPRRPSSTTSPEKSAAPPTTSTAEPPSAPTNPICSTKNRKN